MIWGYTGSLESRVLDNLRLNLQVRVEGILNIKKVIKKLYFRELCLHFRNRCRSGINAGMRVIRCERYIRQAEICSWWQITCKLISVWNKKKKTSWFHFSISWYMEKLNCHWYAWISDYSQFMTTYTTIALYCISAVLLQTQIYMFLIFKFNKILLLKYPGL